MIEIVDLRSLLDGTDGAPVPACLFLLAMLVLLLIERERAFSSALRRSRDEVHALASELLAAQECERARIAGELHDDINQQLAAVSIRLSGLRRASGAETWRALSELQSEVNAASNAVRRLSHALHPGILRHTGLDAALREHCAEVSASQPVPIAYTGDESLTGLPLPHALCLYRVAQESIRNALQHAAPHSLRVTLKRVRGIARLTVEDDGIGFDRASQRRRVGLGLTSMAERIRQFDGTFLLRTARRRGTVIVARIPIPRVAGAVPRASSSEEILYGG